MGFCTTNITTDKFFLMGHGLVDDTPIVFSNTVTTTGYTDGVTYYVALADEATGTFRISTTVGGGGLVNLTGGNGSTNFNTVTSFPDTGDCTFFADPGQPGAYIDGEPCSDPVPIPHPGGGGGAGSFSSFSG